MKIKLQIRNLTPAVMIVVVTVLLIDYFATPQAEPVHISISSYPTLEAAVLSLGSAQAIVDIDSNAVCSSANSIPSNLLLNVVHPNKIINNGDCKIHFYGKGLANASSLGPVLSNFEPGDIVFSYSGEPVQLSSDLWDNESLSDRLNNAIAAMRGKTGTITASPGDIDKQVILASGLNLYFTKGTYTVSASTTPFILQSNTKFYGEGQEVTRIVESPHTPEFIRASGVAAYPYDGYNENIEVRGITFAGNERTKINSALSAVLLGNVKGCSIHHNSFYQTHGFATFVGGMGTAGHSADGCTITENVIDGLLTQSIGTINGRNIKIFRNKFINIQRLASAPFAAVIDIEPNVKSDVCSEIEITDNVLDGSNAQQNWHGIVLQAANSETGCINGVISNNQIIGTQSPSVEGVHLASGIVIQGAQNIRVVDNYIQGAMQMAIAIEGSRDLSITNNRMQNAGGGGNPGIATTACYHCEWLGNTIENPPTFAADDTVKESELTTTATSSGNVITITGGQRFYSFNKGLTLVFNGLDRTIVSVADLGTIAVNSPVGAVSAKSIGPRDIDTRNNTVFLNAHGFQDGARLRYDSRGEAIRGLSSGTDYFVVRATRDSFQLAAAPNGVPIDLLSSGAGSQSLTPVLRTKFSSNIYKNNKFGRIERAGN